MHRVAFRIYNILTYPKKRGGGGEVNFCVPDRKYGRKLETNHVGFR